MHVLIDIVLRLIWHCFEIVLRLTCDCFGIDLEIVWRLFWQRFGDWFGDCLGIDLRLFGDCLETVWCWINNECDSSPAMEWCNGWLMILAWGAYVWICRLCNAREEEMFRIPFRTALFRTPSLLVVGRYIFDYFSTRFCELFFVLFWENIIK